MSPAVAWQAVRPTARAMLWWPVVGAAAILVALASYAADLPSTLPAFAAGALASAAIVALHDPADALLAAVPTGRLARRLLRLTLVAGVVLPTLVLLDRLVGPGAATPTLALTLVGLAALAWTPPELGVLVAALVPLGWVLSGLWLVGLDPLGTSPLTYWWGHPWAIGAIAGIAVVAGRHR